MEKSLTRPRTIKYWFWLWIVLYVMIIIVGITAPESWVLTLIKVGGVFLCSIYSLKIFPTDHLLQAAMITTFLADCLLAGDNISIIGLTVFFLAQCTHLYRLIAPPSARFRVIWLLIIGLLAMVINYIFGLVPPIFVIASFYALALILNIIMSWRWRHQNPHNFYANCALIGFILFACCDLCTGVSYLSLTKVFPEFLYALANFFAWFFYYPSQILVSNSSKCATIKAKEGKC